MVPRDWFAELLERWRREIASEPLRHTPELNEAIRGWVERQGAHSQEPLGGQEPSERGQPGDD